MRPRLKLPREAVERIAAWITILSHPPILETCHRVWPDEAHCAADAAALAAQPPVADALIELDGPLGAGKTTFARHLLRALGVAGHIKSPTYTIVEPYETRLPDGSRLAIWHCDFYRFADPREWEDAGLREIFASRGLKLCEWAVRAAPLLPPPDLRLAITVPVSDEQRRRAVQAEARSALGVALLEGWR